MRLTSKILLLALFPLVLGGPAILIAGFLSHRQALVHESNDRALAEVERHTEAIRSFFDKYLTSLRVLAATRTLQEGYLPEILAQLRLWERTFGEIEALHFGDAEGIVHGSSGKSFYAGDRPFHPAIENGETVITGAMTSRATGEPIVLILVPVFNQEGRRVGALGGNIRIALLNEQIRQIKVGPTGFAVLMDEAGNVVSEALAAGSPLNPQMAEALRSASPSPIHLSLNGEACRAHYRRIPSTQWTLALVDKEDEALVKVRTAGMITLVMLAGTLVLTVLMELALRKLVVAPVRGLMEIQRRVAAGDRGARVQTFSTDELGELAQSFNQMADSLDMANCRLRENEARLGRLFHFAPVAIGVVGQNRTISFVNDGTVELFGYRQEELVGQDTRILYSDDAEYERVGRLLYGGVKEKGLGIAEARLRRKDGTGLDAHISMAPQDVEQGSSELVVVMLDITERKRAEEALRRRRDELAALNQLTRAVTSQTTLENACSVAIKTIVEVLNLELAVLFSREGEELHLSACGPAPWDHPINAAPAQRVGDCLCRLAAQEGQSMYCRDIHQDSRCTWDECKRAGLHSFAAIPLRLGNETIGVLGVASESERDFAKSGNLLETLADQLAVSVHNARLFEQTRAYAAELEQEIAQRMQAEEALRKNERRLSLAVSATADAIWEWNAVTQENYFSPRWYEMLGYEDREFPMSHETWSQLCHPEDFEAAAARIEAVLRSHEDTKFETEFRLRAKDGSWVWILSRGNIVERTAEGAPLLLCGTDADITERKKAEEALRTSELELRSMFRAAPVGICLLRDRVFVRVNTVMTRMFGYAPEELIGRSSRMVYESEEDYLRVGRMLRSEAWKMGSLSTELRCRRKDGSLINIILNMAAIDPADPSAGYVAMAMDITERKQAEEALRANRQLLHTVISNAPIILYAIDRDGTISLADGRGLAAFGFRSSEIQGQSGYHRFRKVPDVLTHLRRVLSGEEFSEIVEAGGRVHDVHYAPLLSATGEVEGAITVAVDVTERKKLEEQLSQAQKMEAIGRLAGGIAHDFNNILSAIVGYSELARMALPEDTRARSFVSEVLQASERAKDLVQQILVFSRQSEEQPQPIIVTPVIKEALKLLRASIPSTIEISQSIQTTDTVVVADPTRIHQIVMNLCTNAYHAMMERGGALSVSTEEIEQKRERPVLDPQIPPGHYFVLTVSDTGPGIHPAIRDKIFDPYFTTKEKDKGTGLGLAVVHGIVERFGGKVEVESSLGRGAVFRVVLPVVQTHVGRYEPQDVQFEYGNEHILLVDDEVTLVAMGKGLLESLGYRVVALSSSLEAFDAFCREPHAFDLVITDFTMPGMTGGKLAERIHQARPGMPIILCSGQSDQFSELDAHAIGIVEYVRKPYNLAVFSATVRRVLDQTRLKPEEGGNG
ncbi:MAG: PAS domain S-box protein [Syntrophobacteraceae bacterium]